MISPRRHFRGERGVSAVLVALVFGALMVVSAFGVDIGEAYAERRHDQNTVDAASMSGIVEAALGGGVIDEVVAEVRLKVDTTLGRTLSDQEWLDCKDPNPLALNTKQLQAGNPTIDTPSECISFSKGFNRIRVRLPDQEVPGVFAPIMGLAQIDTSAFAEAEVIPNKVG
jgi:uncharacterized membrane protein